MKIITKYNEEVEVKEGMFFVTMTDNFLSGWGKATNKICKQVVICASYREAQIIVDGINNLENRDGMRYINICSRLPRYNGEQYKVCYMTFESCTLWISKSNIK